MRTTKENRFFQVRVVNARGRHVDRMCQTTLRFFVEPSMDIPAKCGQFVQGEPCLAHPASWGQPICFSPHCHVGVLFFLLLLLLLILLLRRLLFNIINNPPSTQHHQHNTINTTPSSQHHQHNTNNTTPSTQHHQHNIINTTPSTQHGTPS